MEKLLEHLTSRLESVVEKIEKVNGYKPLFKKEMQSKSNALTILFTEKKTIEEIISFINNNSKENEPARTTIPTQVEQ